MEKRTRDYRGYRDLKVYQFAYQLALEIHQLSKGFPKEERYVLVDQIRSSSRSVPSNIAEAWKKRRYEKAFISKLIDCAGEGGETEVWLDFAFDFKYINQPTHDDLMERYAEVNRMLNGMIEKSYKFCK